MLPQSLAYASEAAPSVPNCIRLGNSSQVRVLGLQTQAKRHGLLQTALTVCLPAASCLLASLSTTKRHLFHEQAVIQLGV